jgi:hypothetical protein
MSLFLVGCATTSTRNFNSQIGSLTYDQAVAQLGAPKQTTTLADQTRIAEWLLRSEVPGHVEVVPVAAAAGSSLAAASVGSRTTFVVPPEPALYLHMIFSPDGKLNHWSRESDYSKR